MKGNNKELVEESKELFNTLKEQYLKLRKEHWELLEENEKLKELIEKLSKELAEKTRLLNQYHLDFGDEILDKTKKKVTKANKKNDTDSIEELLK